MGSAVSITSRSFRSGARHRYSVPYACAVALAVAGMLLQDTILARDVPMAGSDLALGISPQPCPAVSTNATVALTPRFAFTFACPGTQDGYLTAPTSTWFRFSEVRWDLVLAREAPTNVQVLVFIKDWDYFWYQQLMPGFAVPGTTNRYRLDLNTAASAWEPRDHHGTWQRRVLMQPQEVGIRVFCDDTGVAAGTLANITALWRQPEAVPPVIRDVRPSASRVPCYERFEVTFDLPDRYANPFDPAEVAATAVIQTPDGRTVPIDGFYTREYYRLVSPTGEAILPQGPAHWKVRYAPTQPGVHRYTLRVRDAQGTTEWGPATFVAASPKQPGYVRVSGKDPRYFEYDNGRPFFPIGHNIRSPSDDRMNKQFPWTKRWPEGSVAYSRYFSAMREHGENFSEIWMAAWSLGLEWTAGWRGYHGIGQYNLMHAWELDRVIDGADQNGIYLNLVLFNHGKFAAETDSEWEHNPFNKQNGGYLARPEDFFSDSRAMADFRQLMRYIVARWGYSPRIFAWELWSELNLTGIKDKSYRTSEYVEWHRQAAALINGLDPNHHLITTHYSGDYNLQNLDITALPGITHASVDAYHGDPRALRIVDLLQATARYNNPLNKPVLVTEFGGNWDAQGLTHLEGSLHAGLWSSTCIPIGGTPLFWWWGLIEEENYYPEYQAVSRFMQGEDRRDPALQGYTPALTTTGAAGERVRACALKSGTRAIAWVYDTLAYDVPEAVRATTVSNAIATFSGLSNGLYAVEFWNTTEGTRTTQKRLQVKDGILAAPLPPFRRDMAVKVKLQKPDPSR